MPVNAFLAPAMPLARVFGKVAMPKDMIGFMLLLPAAALLLIGLIFPIIGFLYQSISNPEVPNILPRTVAVIGEWSGDGLPPARIYGAFASDIAEAERLGTVGALARRMNFVKSGYRTLFMKTGAAMSDFVSTGDSGAEAALAKIDSRWSDPEVWQRIRGTSGHYTASYYLAALDMERTPTGDIRQVPESNRIFVTLFIRTFQTSLFVMLACLLLGYPAAYLLANAPRSWVPLLLTAVLLPFWTSILVRTTAWVVLLQNEGLINKSLKAFGWIDKPLPLFHNQFAVIVAMVHVLLPYMILPLYASMRDVPPSLMRAASALGANPLRALMRVYLPQTFRGAAAGCLLVFILAIGYYVTPQLVGGPADQMVSQFIAMYTNQSLNWGLASSLGTILLLLTLALYFLFARLSGGRAGI